MKAAYFHQGSTTYVPTEAKIYSDLVVYPNISLIVLYSQSDADVKDMKVHHMVYVPPPFVGLLLEVDLSPMQVWACLHGTIYWEVKETPYVQEVCIQTDGEDNAYKQTYTRAQAEVLYIDVD